MQYFEYKQKEYFIHDCKYIHKKYINFNRKKKIIFNIIDYKNNNDIYSNSIDEGIYNSFEYDFEFDSNDDMINFLIIDNIAKKSLKSILNESTINLISIYKIIKNKIIIIKSLNSMKLLIYDIILDKKEFIKIIIDNNIII